jgi:hypothetical protein
MSESASKNHGIDDGVITDCSYGHRHHDVCPCRNDYQSKVKALESELKATKARLEQELTDHSALIKTHFETEAKLAEAYKLGDAMKKAILKDGIERREEDAANAWKKFRAEGKG